MATRIWNWQLKQCPKFSYYIKALRELETQFLEASGIAMGMFKNIKSEDKNQILVDLLSDEALKTSAIEGDYLNRESIQESIKENLGMITRAERFPRQNIVFLK